MAAPFQIGTTPNPNSIRVGLSESRFPKPVTYRAAAEAEGDPLAKALFAIKGVTQIFMLNNFISINKAPEADWAKIEPEVAAALVQNLDG